MSKTAQRKREMFKQGQDDYLSGYGFRWKRHPFLGYYARGYHEAKREMKVRFPFLKKVYLVLRLVFGPKKSWD